MDDGFIPIRVLLSIESSQEVESLKFKTNKSQDDGYYKLPKNYINVDVVSGNKKRKYKIGGNK